MYWTEATGARPDARIRAVKATDTEKARTVARARWRWDRSAGRVQRRPSRPRSTVPGGDGQRFTEGPFTPT